MKKKTKIGLVAGAAVLVLGAGYTVFVAPLLQQDKWIYIEDEVMRGSLTVGVTESGSLDYGITSVLYDLDLTVGTSTSEDEEDEEEEETVQKYLRVEEIAVAPGQRVQTGDLLVRFTEDSVKGVRQLLESALVDAKADYNEAESEYELSALEAQTTYEMQMITRKYASDIYQNASAAVGNDIVSMQIEIQQCNAKVAGLEEKIQEAQESYDEAYEAYVCAKKTMDCTDTTNPDNFMIVQNEYLNAQSRFQNAENALKQAKENLEANAAQIEKLQKEVALAQAKKTIEQLEVKETYLEGVINGDNAEITYNATLESLKEELQEAEETLKNVEEQMQVFEAFVGEDGSLYADGEGIVTEVSYEVGDRLMTAGTVVSYAEPTDMTITVDVTQEDVVSLAVGSPVEIRFTAYKDVKYEGTIRSINTTATSRESATISYEVVIGVEGDTAALYGGMTADITFVTEERNDVLYVSRKAIVEENGKNYVYVKTLLGGKELREVKTGIKNSTSVEIISGLEEGDVIYIASRVSDEAAVAETGTGEGSGEVPMNMGNGAWPDFGGGEMPDMSNMPDMGGMPGRERR